MQTKTALKIKIEQLKLPVNEKAALLEFKQILKKQLGTNVRMIQLFGSKARGDWRKESDIDVLVVLRKTTDDQINFIYDTVMSLCGKYGVYLSVKIFSESEFKYYRHIPTIFMRKISKEAITV